MLLERQPVPGELGKDLHRSIGTHCKQPGGWIFRHYTRRHVDSQKIGRDRATPHIVCASNTRQTEDKACIAAAEEWHSSRRPILQQARCLLHKMMRCAPECVAIGPVASPDSRGSHRPGIQRAYRISWFPGVE